MTFTSQVVLVLFLVCHNSCAYLHYKMLMNINDNIEKKKWI